MKETAYLLQAALVCTWWLGLASSPEFFEAFQFTGIAPTAFWSFIAPDLILIALLSVLRAYRNSEVLELIVLGAFAYAALYCCNATFLTASGYLPSGLMVLGLAYNIFLCFNESLFRTSRSTRVVSNAIKTSIQIACIWLLALVVAPYVLLDAFGDLSMPIWNSTTGVGVVLFAACSVLGLVSSYFMVRDGDGTPLPLDQTNQLVVSGPYRYVRNPMAIAGIGQGLAVAILFQSVPVLAYAILGAIVWHLVVRPFEERDMANRFGESYLKYKQRVACWIPTLR